MVKKTLRELELEDKLKGLNTHFDPRFDLYLTYYFDITFDDFIISNHFSPYAPFFIIVNPFGRFCSNWPRTHHGIKEYDKNRLYSTFKNRSFCHHSMLATFEWSILTLKWSIWPKKQSYADQVFSHLFCKESQILIYSKAVKKQKCRSKNRFYNPIKWFFHKIQLFHQNHLNFSAINDFFLPKMWLLATILIEITLMKTIYINILLLWIFLF